MSLTLPPVLDLRAFFAKDGSLGGAEWQFGDEFTRDLSDDQCADLNAAVRPLLAYVEGVLGHADS